MGMLAILTFAIAAGAQSPSGTVAGRVTELLTGRPVPRVVVSAMGSDRKVAAEVLTDADGRYELTGLPPGAYAIRATNDEHRSTYLQQWFGATAPSMPFGVPPGFNVELKAGERRTAVDMALTRALAIEGQVMDPWGDPIANVDVQVSSAGGRSMAGGSSYTNDLGTYRVYGLMPGRYRACVTPRGDRVMADAASLGPTCHPSAVAASEASDVTLTSQDATGIDIRVQRTGTRTITGNVYDATGVPVDDASVSAHPFEENGTTSHARTIAGAFTLKGLAPGRYVVSASIGGGFPGDATPPKREREMSWANVDLAASDTASTTLALTKATTVPGTIAFEGALPAAERRALHLTVESRTPPDFWPWLMGSGPPETTAVKDDLSFSLGQLYRVPGLIVLHGLPDGWALKTVRYDDRDITFAPTDFGSAPAARLELTVTNRVATPSAKAVDEHGDDVPAAQMIVIPASPDRWSLTFATVPHEPPHGPISKLGAMLPGDYFVAALKIEDFVLLMRDPSRVAAIASIGTRVTLAAADSPVLTLRIVTLPDK